jgi:hypothetical protein
MIEADSVYSTPPLNSSSNKIIDLDTKPNVCKIVQTLLRR